MPKKENRNPSLKKSRKRRLEPRYFNREIGLLKFNKRVLFQAQDPRNPLLERVKFLNIYFSNLDEFFMKRVGGLKRQHLAGVASISHDGLTAEQQLRKIYRKVLDLNSTIEDLILKDLIPSLKKEKIRILKWKELSDAEVEWCKRFFIERVFPVLTPMAVDLGHPFPVISNLSTSLAVSLQSPTDEEVLFARIKIPQFFPKWVAIQDSSDEEGDRFASLIDIVTNNLELLFPKMKILKVMPFRITRNVDIEAIEEGAEDLLEMIEEEVKQRRFAEVVRLEHGPKPDPWLKQFLLDELELTDEDCYEYAFGLDYKDLGAITALNKPHLKYKPWQPVTPLQLADEENSIFNIIRSGDLLVHHPYESFNSSVERFVATAAQDPNVIAIKMTLYRTNEDSSILHSLVRAAEAGKQVVVLVELKARFDEEKNIQWAQMLEKAGAHVVYGIVGLKTHAKLTLVIRKEKEEFRSYTHIGTGNYHTQTAKLYTDFGLFTSRLEITNEVVEVFHYLTGRSLKSDYKSLLVAPINLKTRFLEMIEREALNAKAKKPSGIVAKFNSLEDKDIIEALYQASQAGVPIQLLVRGFCCLKPQVEGLSENIDVVSIIGPFLEHSRVFYFRNAQSDPIDGEFYLGSADWMGRNLLGRVEVVTPVLDRSGREKIWESLQILLKDERLAWDMKSNGDYVLRKPEDPKALGAHELLMELTKTRAHPASPILNS